MLQRTLVTMLKISVFCFFGGTVSANAQGLIWELPNEGEWVRYEGTYKQTELFQQDQSSDGQARDVIIPPNGWTRHLTIKSLGTETAEYNGKMEPCRWIEFVVITGLPKGELDPGPVGTRIFKVLVPESRVIAAQADSRNIPVSFLPIVEGYRKIGNAPAVPIKSKVLQVYPLISLVGHYRKLTQQGDPSDPAIPLGPVTATKLAGVQDMQSPTGRSKAEVTLWRSSDVPFGLAKWEVKFSRWTKERNEAIANFRQVSIVEVEMHAVTTGTNASSSISSP